MLPLWLPCSQHKNTKNHVLSPFSFFHFSSLLSRCPTLRTTCTWYVALSCPCICILIHSFFLSFFHLLYIYIYLYVCVCVNFIFYCLLYLPSFLPLVFSLSPALIFFFSFPHNLKWVSCHFLKFRSPLFF